MLATLAGQRQILVVNGGTVAGHDPKDGRILWEHPWPGEFPKVTQPLVVDSNRVFVAAGYGVGCAMLRIESTPAGGWTATELWKNRNLKPKFTNLVRRGDYVYGLDDGILACLNLTDGRREWKDGRYGHGQILLVGDLLVVQAESGDVALVQPDAAGFRELSRFAAIRGKTWNNPVLAGSLLMVRNDEEAAGYRLPLDPQADRTVAGK
jgi:outer membrane protein assembly factor BamB